MNAMASSVIDVELLDRVFTALDSADEPDSRSRALMSPTLETKASADSLRGPLRGARPGDSLDKLVREA
jgi:hypothetical protein